MRLSGLQKDVLGLYRSCLRASRSKPKETRPHFEAFARSEFDKNMKIDKRDFAAIEFLLRKGRRQLEVYSAPGIKDIKDDAYAQFALRGESASSTKIQHPSPSASCRNSRLSPAVGNHMADQPANEPINNGLRRVPDSADEKRQGRTTPVREKRFGVADPLAWDVINRSLTQQRRLSSLIGVDDTAAVPPKLSGISTANSMSRTPSRRRALNRFTRELKKYADVAGAAGRIPVITPTISDSRVSMQTVKPLVPYKDEFLAAGLAVTSTEQGRQSARKTRPHGSVQVDRPNNHSNGQSQARKKMDLNGDGTSSSTSPATSCTSPGSYVDFNSPMLHAFESLKPAGKIASMAGDDLPVRIQHVKRGQIKPNDLSLAQPEHIYLQHRSHRPTMQSIPEIQLWPKPTLPAKYVTAKKDATVGLINDYCEQSDQGLRPEEDNSQHHGAMADAKQSLGRIGIQGGRDLTRGVLSKSYPEPIGTIEEESDMNSRLMGSDVQNRCQSRTDPKEMVGMIQGIRQRPDIKSPVAHESSVPSLPFAARLAASTASSLQRALDDACRKVDDESLQAGNASKQENIKQGLPQLPRQNSRHDAAYPLLPRRPCSAEKIIYLKRNMPTVEASSSTSKPLPPEPVSAARGTPETGPDTRPDQPSRKARPAPQGGTGKRNNAVAELAKAEEMLKDLDVFLNDYDDADIEDRDVIKGLQVAIHAAADDLYDGYIRHKTGLRIRRFLADLKSFEEASQFDSTDQRAREKRAESRKREGARSRKEHR
ncbi:hypothetical protein F4802DRAFT_615273 [Xylaria palmicola]|nr:hypothetical protein F4802DRAFT_615273 [Xylaria palmicola]